MEESPLMRNARRRLAQQREQRQAYWEQQLKARRGFGPRVVLRILAFVVLILLVAYRLYPAEFVKFLNSFG